MKFPYFCQSLLVLCATAISGFAAAQESVGTYPSRPVTWIVPTGPGGGVDLESRLYARKLSETMGRNFVVDYKPGAGSTIGAAFVAKAAPDGYTIGVLTPSHTISELVYPTLPYDINKDFAFISLASKRPSLFVVPASSSAKTLNDYVAMARSKPNQLNVGTSGSGTIGHLALEWFHNMAGAEVTYVHYKGGNPAYTALIAGQLDGVIGSVAGLLPYVKSGKARILAVTVSERIALLPDVPTMQEQGFKDYEYSQWIGVVAPAKTPLPIINKLSGEIHRIVRLPEISEKLAVDGTVMVGSSPQELKQYIAAETARWKKVAATAKINLVEQ